MCGVIGMYSPKLTIEQKKLLVKLIYHSKIRGLHAFGYAYKLSEVFFSYKSLNIKDFLTQVMEIKEGQEIQFIAHNRYSTSGDFKKLENNQPINLGNDYLVFNGVVSQATKEENEAKYNMKLQTENDGEIVLRKIIKGEGQEFIKKNGSFAGLYLGGKEAFAAHNNFRPLWKAEAFGAKFFFSTKDIGLRSGLNQMNKAENYEPLS